MFTGIIEDIGEVIDIRKEEKSIHFQIKSKIVPQLYLGESIAHSGVCLTVTDKFETYYCVTAVKETLQKTNLSYLRIGDFVNIERSMRADSRFSGHIVQGHIDTTATCKDIVKEGASWYFTFCLSKKTYLIVKKGSICVNGISLTIAELREESFKIAIIPFTFYHTQMKYMQLGEKVNIEFDIIGKYIKKLVEARM